MEASYRLGFQLNFKKNAFFLPLGLSCNKLPYLAIHYMYSLDIYLQNIVTIFIVLAVIQVLWSLTSQLVY